MKYLIGFFIFIIAMIVLLANYSTKETTYKCIDNDGKTELYAKITEWKWWIFWSKSDGYLNVEIPEKIAEFFEKIEISKNSVFIYKHEKFVGALSTLSNSLSIQDDYLSFNGKCVVQQ